MIKSIENQTYADFNVIFIDDGSTDGTGDYIKNKKFDFHYSYYYQNNSGRSAARNLGIAKSDCEYIIFSDDDLILHPCFIEEHAKIEGKNRCISHGKIFELPFMKYFKDPAHPEINNPFRSYDNLKMMGLNEDDITLNFEEKIDKRKKTSSLETLIQEIHATKTGLCNWIAFTGGNVCVPRSWLLAAGGYDEKFALNWGCEDMELGYRFFLENKLFVYNENAINYHMTHIRANYKNEHVLSSQYFFNKHNNPLVLKFHEFAIGKLSREDFIKEALLV